MSPISKTLASSALAAVLSLPANAQGIVTQKNITLALAQTIANAAIAQCHRALAFTWTLLTQS